MKSKEEKIWVEGEWSQVEKDEITQQESSDVKEESQLIVLEKEHQRFYDKLRAKIEDFLQKKTGGRFDKYILLAPDLFVLLARLMKDRRVPTKSKAIAGLAVAYFISPMDFLPEMIAGPIGFLDDIIVAAYAISKIMQDVEPSILREHWSGESDLLASVQELLKKAEDLVDGKILGKLKGLINKK
ncbi:MAG TPA: YkvA family protein [Bacillota bacterium]|nr:YkvA family protein [Bacillota bacterium]